MSECFSESCDESFTLQQVKQDGATPSTTRNTTMDSNGWSRSFSSESTSALSANRSSRPSLLVSNNHSDSMTAITPRSSRLGRGSIILQQMTVNKLQFQNDFLYGRDREIQQIKEVFEKSKKMSSRELVLLAGTAGTGKSALALQLSKTIRRTGGFYMAGKFDLQQRDEPYSGIVAACRELCQDILAHKDGAYTNRWSFPYDDLKDRLDEELGPDAEVLTMVIPNLLQIVGGERADESSSGTAYLEAKHRFKFAFRRFMRVVCSFGPVVLTLDDLQWADVASFELIETLLTDEENEGSLMLIGSYRSDEVNDAHLLTNIVRDLEKLKETRLGITKISIGALEVSDVSEMLSDLMTMSEEKTLDLAECVHKKTLGNIFFVVQYLRSLVDKDLLCYSIGVNKWTWNIDGINANTMATDNVVDLMKEKLNNLPSSVRAILPMIACLGSSFELLAFRLVIEHFNKKLLGSESGITKSTLVTPEEFMSVCEDEGLIIDCGREWFKWEHDKIQEAALSLVAEDELPSIQFEVGELLLSTLSFDDSVESLFVIVNLLNQGPDSRKTDPIKRIEIAKLSLRAGENALESSAFTTATSYFTNGMELLPEDKWVSEYDLSLQLFSTAAEAEFCVGNFEIMEQYCEEVIAQERCPFLDKRRVYNKLLHSIAEQGRFQKAQDLCVAILAKLGCHFPKHGMALCTVAGIVRTEISLKKTIKRISHLPMIEDESKRWVMSLLDNLVTYTYQNDPVLLPLVMLKGHRLTIRYGLSEFAPASLSLVGLLLAGSVGDFSGAKAYVEHALALSKNNRAVQARVLFVAYQFVMHWQIPTEICKKELLQGYTIGMKTGDTESACWCIYCYLEMTFHTGGSLVSFLTDCQAYTRQMQEVKQHKILMFLKLWWQLAVNMTAESSRGHILSGDILTEEEMIAESERTQDVHLKGQLDRMKMYTSFWFGKHEDVVKTMFATGTEKGLYEKKSPGTFGLCTLYFHCALSCISLYRTTGRRKKYKRIAKKFTRKIKKWVKKGNPNVMHYESMMDAELAALAGDLHVATKHYEVAILLAGRRGFMNDRALAHERFGEYVLSRGDTSDALYHFDRAIQLYRDWGAHAMIKTLKAKHTELLKPPSEIKLLARRGDETSTLSLGGPSGQFELGVEVGNAGPPIAGNACSIRYK